MKTFVEKGIYAAMNLFVEIAFPTAVMLTFDRTKVITRQEIGKYSARTRADDFGEKYNNSLAKLFQNRDWHLRYYGKLFYQVVYQFIGEHRIFVTRLD